MLEGEYAGAARRRPAPRPAEPVVVFAGRHIPEKRVPALVAGDRAARASACPSCAATIFGDGPERAGGAGARSRAHGLGGRRRARRASSTPRRSTRRCARALCLVLPSRREGYGLVVVEAAARGDAERRRRGPTTRDRAGRGRRQRLRRRVRVGRSDLAAAIVRVRAAGPALRESTAAWFGRNARRLSLEQSLATVLAAYGHESIGGREPPDTDHRSHRPGRRLPRGATARGRRRGDRHGAHAEGALERPGPGHLEGRVPLLPADLLDPASIARAVAERRARTRSTTSPRRRSCPTRGTTRPRSIGGDRRRHRRAAGRRRGARRRRARAGRQLERDLRRRRRLAAAEDVADAPAQPLRRGEARRAWARRRAARTPRPLPRLGDHVQPRVAAAARAVPAAQGHRRRRRDRARRRPRRSRSAISRPCATGRCPRRRRAGWCSRCATRRPATTSSRRGSAAHGRRPRRRGVRRGRRRAARDPRRPRPRARSTRASCGRRSRGRRSATRRRRARCSAGGRETRSSSSSPRWSRPTSRGSAAPRTRADRSGPGDRARRPQPRLPRARRDRRHGDLRPRADARGWRRATALG